MSASVESNLLVFIYSSTLFQNYICLQPSLNVTFQNKPYIFQIIAACYFWTNIWKMISMCIYYGSWFIHKLFEINKQKSQTFMKMNQNDRICKNSFHQHVCESLEWTWKAFSNSRNIISCNHIYSFGQTMWCIITLGLNYHCVFISRNPGKQETESPMFTLPGERSF